MTLLSRRRAFDRTFARRASAAWILSLFVHGVVLAVLLAASHHRPASPGDPQAAERPHVLPGIIWLPQGGISDEAHGGGGSGNHMVAPPGRLELPGHDALAVPVGKPAPAPLNASASVAPDVAAPIAQLDIAALATLAGTVVRPGSLDGVPDSTSLGPGTGGRAGHGDGTGDGPGRGPGRGPGSGGNQGGGPRTLGSTGLRDPKVVREVKPIYTPEAMRARIQGTAMVECVVLPDGTVGEAEVVKSLDRSFGLDEEALKAARRWLFQPGTINGQPVAVRVWIELAFSIK